MVLPAATGRKSNCLADSYPYHRQRLLLQPLLIVSWPTDRTTFKISRYLMSLLSKATALWSVIAMKTRTAARSKHFGLCYSVAALATSTPVTNPTGVVTSRVHAYQFSSSASPSLDAPTSLAFSSNQTKDSSNASPTALQLLENLSQRLQEPPLLRVDGDHVRMSPAGIRSTKPKKEKSTTETRRIAELATEFCQTYENLPSIQVPSNITEIFDDNSIDLMNTNSIYQGLNCQRSSILVFLASSCRPSEDAVHNAIEHYRNSIKDFNGNTVEHHVDPKSRHWDGLVSEIRHAVIPPYENIINFILKQNSITGMRFLVALREDLTYLNTFQKNVKESSSSSIDSHASHGQQSIFFAQQLKQFDSYLRRLFQTWFTPGMMEIRRIEYDRTPASIIETIATKEQVHPMRSLDDLRSRLGQGRRVFGLFHPLLPGVPLIFVHVALLQEIPSKMQDVMIDETNSKNTVRVAKASVDHTPLVACFYSISNGQKALSGLGLGEYLIKQAVQELKKELPSLQTFVTLSPIPRFRKWLQTKLIHQDSSDNPFFDGTILSDEDKQSLIDCGLIAANGQIDGGDLESLKISWGSFWRLLTEEVDFSTQFQASMPSSTHTPGDLDDRQRAVLKTILTKLTVRYLCCEKHHGRPLDAVCNFHVGNGALVHRVNGPVADPSRRGLESSFGMMVNYLYDLEAVNDNQAAFEFKYSIPVSPDVQGWIDRIKT